ncbi:hypothetical protein T265_05130 [Opisthorchis viverrini]|uniref:Uncharacterized protein n=1 Tax=Opisthorchis viverrini TaxID=6198 RepID=A0A074ZX41_OPIVI|nr:hypothetical protein T265_05130 [Opisthorchis viverrini]KER27925.1 hypothetical protein T265_05130 [Opisthorchis viverrini]
MSDSVSVVRTPPSIAQWVAEVHKPPHNVSCGARGLNLDPNQYRLLSTTIDGPPQMWAKWVFIECNATSAGPGGTLKLTGLQLSQEANSHPAPWCGNEDRHGISITHSSSSTVHKILKLTVRVHKAYPTIRRISEDRPLEAQKLGHTNPREEARYRLLISASSAEPKLVAEPTVVIVLCAFRSTPTQTVVTSDRVHTEPPQTFRPP